MAELKTTTIYGDLYINNRLGVGTRNPAYTVNCISNTSGDWGHRFEHSISGALVYMCHSGGYGLAVDAGSLAGSGNYHLQVQRGATTYLQVRGDGYVGIGAAPSTNGWVQITSINTSTAHFSLTNGVSNANASNTYTFRGWWGVYYNSPGFNGGTSGLYYIQMYS